MNRRAIVGSFGALLFSAGAAVLASTVGAPKGPNDAKPRVVSLSPALTETALALQAEGQLVAVSDYCELPKGLQLPRVGTSLTPSFEAIARLRPTMILCDGSAAAKQRELGALTRCETLPWLTLAEVVASTRRLGALLHREQEATLLAERLRARLTSREAPDAPRVLFLLSYDPDRPTELWFVKRNSLHGAALAAAGARNAISHDVPGLPRLSLEQLLALDPDQILILPPPGASLERKQQMLASFRALAPLTAVKTDRVGIVDGTQSVGPSIIRLADALAAMLEKMREPRPPGGMIQ